MGSITIKFDAKKFNDETGFTGDSDDPQDVIESFIDYYHHVIKNGRIADDMPFFKSDMTSFIKCVDYE